MFSKRFAGGLLASTLVLGAGCGLAAAQPGATQPGAVDAAAAQLATRGEAAVATAAALEVLPMKMAGSCPRAYMLKVDLAAGAAGPLAYRIETLDGRISQVLETQARRDGEGGYMARLEHHIDLQERAEDVGGDRLAFSAPSLPEGEPASERDFFERLFGTAADRDPSQGLRQQSFRVRVMAPNEVVSSFDAPSVTCDYTQTVRVIEDQRDGGRDRPGRDPGGRDPGGRDSGGPAGAAGGPN